MEARHIEVWDATTADRLAALNVLPGSDDAEYIETLAFDETGGRLGVIGEEGSGLQFNLARLAETEIGATYLDTQWVRGLNPRFLGYHVDGAIEIWDLPVGQPVARVIQHGGSADRSGPIAFLYAPEARRLVLFGEHRMWIYDTRQGTETSGGSFGVAAAAQTLVSGQKGVMSQYAGLVPVSLSREGGVLLAADRGGATRIWNVTDLREIWSADNLQAAALSPDGRFVVSAGPDDALRAWDLASGKEAWRVAGVNAKVTVKDEDEDDVLRPGVMSLAFSVDGRQVAARLLNRKLRAFEASNGREMAEGWPVHAPGGSWDLPPLETFSPDGTLRAVANDSQVRISRTDGDRELTIVRHDADPDPTRNSVVALSFSPDGRFLVTGSQDRTARVWDLTGQELAFVRHEAPLVAVAFTANGDRVITAAVDRRVHTWMWRDAELEAHVCGRLTRNLTPDEWRNHLGEVPHSATCPNLPLPGK
jgi:WD40 repeat protein